MKRALMVLWMTGCQAPVRPVATGATGMEPGLGEPVLLGAPSMIHARRVIGLAADPSGATLVSAADVMEGYERDEGQKAEPGVRVWETASGRQKAQLGEHEVQAMAATPDASVVAEIDPVGNVEVWDVATRTRRVELATREGTIWIGLDAKGEALFLVTRAGQIERWDIAKAPKAPAIRVDTRSEISAAAGTARGEIVIGDERGQVTMVDLRRGRETRLEAGLGRITSVDISRDGARIAAIDDRQGAVWEVSGQQRIGRLSTGGQAVRLLADRTHAIVSGPTQGQQLALVTIETGDAVILDGWDGHALAFAELPGGRLAAGTWDGPIRIFDLAARRDAAAARGLTTWVQLLGFVPGGLIAASGSFKPERTLRWPSLTAAPIEEPRVLAVSPSGRVRAEFDGEQLKLGAHSWPLEYPPTLAKLAGDDRTLVTMSADQDRGTEITSYDVATGGTRHWIAPLFGQSFAISAGGDQLALGGDELALYDRTTGRLLRRLRANTLNHAELVFTHEDTLLVAASESDGLQIWNTATGQLVRTLYPGERGKRQGTGNTAYTAAVSPDGKLIASGHRDGSVRLWDLATGRLIATQARHRGLVNRATFSPDGRQLATGDKYGQIYVWPIRI